MLKIERRSKSNFYGFGQLGKTSEYFYSQNMKQSLNGISTGWKLSRISDNDDDGLSEMQKIIWFTKGLYDTYDYLLGIDENGRIYGSKNGFMPFEIIYESAASGQEYNGLIFDQTNRLIYATQRYIGLYDPSISDYSDGTVSVTNSSTTVTGTGTTFTSDMVGKRIRIGDDTKFYTVSAFVSATEITLSSSYIGETRSGESYRIFISFDDEKWDLKADYMTIKCTCLYEDYVVVAAANTLALINTVDDSISLSAFDFPEGFDIVGVQGGKNGILIAANLHGRSVLALWTPLLDRSAAPWIWIDEPIKAVIPDESGNWIIITARKVLWSNGYSTTKVLETAVDDYFQSISLFDSVAMQGAIVRNGKLVFLGGISNAINRNMSGLYVLDLSTALFEFVPLDNGVMTGVSNGAIYINNNFQRIIVSYKTTDPFNYAISSFTENFPNYPAIMIERFGNGPGKKVAEGLDVKLALSNLETLTSDTLNYKVTLKIAPVEKRLWGAAYQNGTATNKNEITVDGTASSYNKGQVGDMVWVLDGDCAGEITHIKSISGEGTTSEVWTLENELSDYLQNGDKIKIAPFRHIDTFNCSNVSEVKDLYFNAKSRVVSKAFYVMLIFENLDHILEVEELDFIYDKK